MKLENLFAQRLYQTDDEYFEPLLERKGIKLERILSRGHSTPEGEWYDQTQDEWVMVVRGAAQLCIEGRDELVNMQAGDYILLPAHCRHRVEWTSPEEETVWLALHLNAASEKQ